MKNDESDLKDPLDSLLEDFEPEPFSMTTDNMPATQAVGYPAKIPEATEDNVVCLRGPCLHYMQITQRLKHGNTEGTFAPGEEPIQINRYCNALSETIELEDEVVWDCNYWNPITDNLIKARALIREQWCDKTKKPWDGREALKQEGEE